MKKIVSVFSFILLSAIVFASEKEVFTHIPNGGTEGDKQRTYTTEHFSIIQTKGPGKGDNWVEDTYDDLRLYKNQTLQIIAAKSVGTIDSVLVNIVIVGGKSEMENLLNATYTTNVGDGIIVASDNNGEQGKLTATGKITDFTMTASVGQLRITSIEFYYSDEVAKNPAISVSEDIDFGVVLRDAGVEPKKIDIKAYNLTEDLNVDITTDGEAFKFVKSLNRDGGTIEVQLFTATVGDYSAIVDISANGIKKTVAVKAQVADAVSGADGTKENPYTVEDVLALNNALHDKAWIVGYIWGRPNTKSALQTPAKDDTSIALGAVVEPTEEEVKAGHFVPVQLPNNGNIRKEVGVFTNPDNYGRKILIYGTLEPYFELPGLKNATEYEWVDTENPGSDLSDMQQNIKGLDPNKPVYDILGMPLNIDAVLSGEYKGVVLQKGAKFIVR